MTPKRIPLQVRFHSHRCSLWEFQKGIRDGQDASSKGCGGDDAGNAEGAGDKLSSIAQVILGLVSTGRREIRIAKDSGTGPDGVKEFFEKAIPCHIPTEIGKAAMFETGLKSSWSKG